MFTIIFSFLLLFSTTTIAQTYNATDHFRLACGSSSTTTADEWNGDEGSKFMTANIATASFSSKPSFQDSSVPQIPYSNARIFNTSSSFTYTFPVSRGPKFLRLHFYPATYSNLNPTQSFFSVSSNGYTLLTNFSAFLAASYRPSPNSQPVYHFVKEFIIFVKDAQILNVTFTPSPNSYAFINGIEIVSLPESLYFDAENLNYVGQTSGPKIANNMALETIYRLNMGGGHISGEADTGMYRSWEPDDEFIFGAAFGLTPVNKTPITYTETPNYTAPELVYATQRSMGNMSYLYNLTWMLPVDSGFYYMIRLHFCNIIPQYNRSGQMVFTIFINNQTAEKEADPLSWTQGNGHPVFRDYVLFISDSDNGKGKQDLWLAMHPNEAASAEYGDAYLNGLEAFKLSNTGSLASPNPALSSTPPLPTPASPIRRKKNKTPPYVAIIGGVGGGLVFFSVLVLIVFRRKRRVKNYGITDDKSSYGPASIESKSTRSCHSSLPSDRCRRFSLTEVKAATREFNEECIIGHGGFGKVYKGYIDNGTTTVAIKRLNSSSSQGSNEFHTEIGMLSKLRHVHLVSLIGYCNDDEEMVLVYEYMAHGTLREHLYKSKNPPLSWKTRLQICIGSARGLHYLHTSAKRRIIHRDVKSTNILLDENWVAKVSDFGLSKLGPSPNDPSQTHVSTVVKGSMGYVDPEYYQRQQLTDKSDVYSFGVVLLEVLCARPAMIPGLAKEQVSLAEWGKYCYRKGILDQIIDPKLRDEIAPECLMKFGEVTNGCLKEKGCDRLTMEEVVYKLELALEVQETAEKTGGVVSENQELPFSRHGEATTSDDDMFSGSSAIRKGTSSISSSTYEGFKSETVFSEMGNPTGR